MSSQPTDAQREFISTAIATAALLSVSLPEPLSDDPDDYLARLTCAFRALPDADRVQLAEQFRIAEQYWIAEEL